MGDGKAEERKATERQQFELAERFFSSRAGDRSWVDHLIRNQRNLLFEELKAHQSLHVAQGNEPEAALLLDALGGVAQEDETLRYKYQRLVISEYERRGLGGRALAVMGDLYDEYRLKRSQRARSAEVVMEFGILHDRYGDKEEACSLFKHSIGRYERAEHGYNLAAAWFNTASVLYDLGRTRASINACEKGLTLGGSEHLDLKTHLLLQRANCRERTKELALAAEDYLDAADGYSKLGRRRQQCNILFRVGWLSVTRIACSRLATSCTPPSISPRSWITPPGLASFHLRRAQFLAGTSTTQARFNSIFSTPLCTPNSLGPIRSKRSSRGALYQAMIERRRPLTLLHEGPRPRS